MGDRIAGPTKQGQAHEISNWKHADVTNKLQFVFVCIYIFNPLRTFSFCVNEKWPETPISYTYEEVKLRGK